MHIKNTNTKYLFLHTYDFWNQKDIRHIINIVIGITYIIHENSNRELDVEVFIHEERKNEFFQFIELFEIDSSFIKVMNPAIFYEELKKIEKENVFLFVSGHGIKDKGICSSLSDFSSQTLYKNISEITSINNFFLFFGQCYAGLYRINNNYQYSVKLFAFGCSDQYVGRSSETVIQKNTNTELLRMIAEKIDYLQDQYDLGNKINIFLYEVFNHLGMILNKDILDADIEKYYKKLEYFHAGNLGENNISTDTELLEIENLETERKNFYINSNDTDKYLELEKKINEKKDKLELLNKIYGERNLYNEFQETLKQGPNYQRMIDSNGDEQIIDVNPCFDKILRGIKKEWNSHNFIWFEKKTPVSD